MASAIPLATALISLGFGLTILEQYRQRRKPYQLIWSMGLLLWFIGSLMQFLHKVVGPQGGVLRLWYGSGAMLVPAYLGTGTLYLLAPRKIAHTFMGILLILTILGLLLVVTATLKKPLSDLEGEALTGRGFFPGGVVGLTISLNTYGTIALVGGALWSAWSFWRRRVMPHRVMSNVLIAVGAIAAGLGGLLDRMGTPEPHAVALLIGIVVIYGGFLLSREVFATSPLPFLRRAGSA